MYKFNPFTNKLDIVNDPQGLQGVTDIGSSTTNSITANNITGTGEADFGSALTTEPWTFDRRRFEERRYYYWCWILNSFSR